MKRFIMMVKVLEAWYPNMKEEDTGKISVPSLSLQY